MGMKIGYVLKRYPRFSETFVVNEILAHEEAGVEIEIFSLRTVLETHFQDLLSRVRAPVSAVQHIPPKLRLLAPLLSRAARELPGFLEVVGESGAADGEILAQAMEVALLARERGVDHLHAHFGTRATSVARLAARLAAIPYSFTAHAKDIYFAYEDSVDLGDKIRDASAVFTVSDYNEAHLAAAFGARGVHRLYNGLDLERFAFHAKPTSRRRILAVGRLVEKKGFDVLIDACARLGRDGVAFEADIIGDGPLLPELSARIEAHDLAGSVRLLGPRPQAEVMEAMRGADLFAAPCVVGADGNRDGLPTVLLEAMALGTPCVATPVTGIPELVRDGDTGLLVPERDAAALAGAMERLLAEPAFGARLARAGRALVEAEFDIRRNAARQRAVLDAVHRAAARPRLAEAG